MVIKNVPTWWSARRARTQHAPCCHGSHGQDRGYCFVRLAQKLRQAVAPILVMSSSWQSSMRSACAHRSHRLPMGRPWQQHDIRAVPRCRSAEQAAAMHLLATQQASLSLMHSCALSCTHVPCHSIGLHPCVVPAFSESDHQTHISLSWGAGSNQLMRRSMRWSTLRSSSCTS